MPPLAVGAALMTAALTRLLLTALLAGLLAALLLLTGLLPALLLLARFLAALLRVLLTVLRVLLFVRHLRCTPIHGEPSHNRTTPAEDVGSRIGAGRNKQQTVITRKTWMKPATRGANAPQRPWLHSFRPRVVACSSPC